MNICREYDFGEVKGYEIGFGPVFKPILTVYFYILDGLLIDTGLRNMQRRVLQVLQNTKIEKVILTHYHLDHSGNAAAIQRLLNVPVYGHPLTVKAMSRGFTILPIQLYIWGIADRMEMMPLPAAVESNRFTLEPIHTPGHTADHTVYLERNNGWLFSGDLYCGPCIKYFRSDESLMGTISSLKKILAHDFETLFCAHRRMKKYGKKCLSKKLEFLETIYGKVENLHLRGYDEKQIIREMKAREVLLFKLFTLGKVSFANLVKSALTSIRSHH